MEIRSLHTWTLAPAGARSVQCRLAGLIRQHWDDRPIRTVAGVDVHFPARAVALASVVIMDYPSFGIVEEHAQETPCASPYVPGLLSFREVPALIPVLRRVRTWPDVLLCDGQGVAHPRRLGLASHLGLVLEVPTIGCAKSRLVGEHDEPGWGKGCCTPLRGKGNEVIGTVVRTRAGIKPLYVSVGHLVTLDKAVQIVLGCCSLYRIPEPLRRAHALASG